MIDQEHEYFDRALEIANYAALSEKAKIQYAVLIKDIPEALEAASAAWNRNAVNYVHAGLWFGGGASDDSAAFTTDFYLTVVLLGSLPQKKAEQLWLEILETDMELWEVKQRVDELKKRKPKESKAKEILSDNQWNIVIDTLDRCGRKYDINEYGLPQENEEWVTMAKGELTEALKETK